MSSEICLWIMEQANDTDFRGPCEVIIHCDNKKWIVNSERMYGHVIDTFPIRDESSTRYQGSKLRTILEFYQEIRGLIENGQTVEEIQGVKKLLEDHAEQKVEAKSIVAMSSLSKSGSPLRSSGLVPGEHCTSKTVAYDFCVPQNMYKPDLGRKPLRDALILCSIFVVFL
ncbi:hypothetical protein WG66_016929 [Moniliophthora roreri]|nr:hypothetical protein WG66_016929 [Moniliophthora roreri]